MDNNHLADLLLRIESGAMIRRPGADLHGQRFWRDGGQVAPEDLKYLRKRGLILTAALAEVTVAGVVTRPPSTVRLAPEGLRVLAELRG